MKGTQIGRDPCPPSVAMGPPTPFMDGGGVAHRPLHLLVEGVGRNPHIYVAIGHG